MVRRKRIRWRTCDAASEVRAGECAGSGARATLNQARSLLCREIPYSDFRDSSDTLVIGSRL